MQKIAKPILVTYVLSYFIIKTHLLDVDNFPQTFDMESPHRKEKHCENCGKVVNSYWQRKHMNRGDIYDVCGPDCYVEYYKTIVDYAPPPEFSYGCANSAKWFWE